MLCLEIRNKNTPSGEADLFCGVEISAPLEKGRYAHIKHAAPEAHDYSDCIHSDYGAQTLQLNPAIDFACGECENRTLAGSESAADHLRHPLPPHPAPQSLEAGLGGASAGGARSDGGGSVADCWEWLVPPLAAANDPFFSGWPAW